MYVTDHVAVEQKYVTSSEEEDNDFYDYQKAIDDYNSDSATPV